MGASVGTVVGEVEANSWGKIELGPSKMKAPIVT